MAGWTIGARGRANDVADKEEFHARAPLNGAELTARVSRMTFNLNLSG